MKNGPGIYRILILYLHTNTELHAHIRTQSQTPIVSFQFVEEMKENTHTHSLHSMVTIHPVFYAHRQETIAHIGIYVIDSTNICSKHMDQNNTFECGAEVYIALNILYKYYLKNEK